MALKVPPINMAVTIIMEINRFFSPVSPSGTAMLTDTVLFLSLSSYSSGSRSAIFCIISGSSPARVTEIPPPCCRIPSTLVDGSRTASLNSSSDRYSFTVPSPSSQSRISGEVKFSFTTPNSGSAKSSKSTSPRKFSAIPAITGSRKERMHILSRTQLFS